ncbi:hypothetical protein ACQZV8_20225 [Magnetococcales bacterium HHB-1]
MIGRTQYPAVFVPTSRSQLQNSQGSEAAQKLMESNVDRSQKAQKGYIEERSVKAVKKLSEEVRGFSDSLKISLSKAAQREHTVYESPKEGSVIAAPQYLGKE